MALVSIIMPVKNAGNFLEECLQSIQNQTFQDWELIAINDHSTDTSLSTLVKYAEDDYRIKWKDNSDSGIISALQLAFALCHGKYVTRMDADDKMPPDRLQLMVEHMESAKPRTIVTGLVQYFSENNNISDGYLAYEKWINEVNKAHRQWPYVYRECVIASPNWMATWADLYSIKAFDNLVYPEDYHLTFKWYENNFKVITVPKVTLLWREHPLRTSRNSDNYNQEAFFNLKINTFIRLDLKENSLVIWGNNPKTRLTKMILSARNVHFIEMDVDNFQDIENIENSQLLIGVYPPEKERRKIERYLNDISMKMGKDFWYL